MLGPGCCPQAVRSGELVAWITDEPLVQHVAAVDKQCSLGVLSETIEPFGEGGEGGALDLRGPRRHVFECVLPGFILHSSWDVLLS